MCLCLCKLRVVKKSLHTFRRAHRKPETVSRRAAKQRIGNREGRERPREKEKEKERTSERPKNAQGTKSKHAAIAVAVAVAVGDD